MKFKIFFSIYTIILSILFSSCNSFSDKYIKRIDNRLIGSDSISFEEIINEYEWDKFLVLPPYSSLTLMSEKYNIDLKKVDNEIEYSEDITTLVILNRNVVVEYIEIPRSKYLIKIKKDNLIRKKNKFIKRVSWVKKRKIISLEEVQ